MKPSLVLAVAAVCACAAMLGAMESALASDDDPALLQADRAAFATTSPRLKDAILDSNLIWTESSGNTKSKLEIIPAIRSGKGLPTEPSTGNLSTLGGPQIRARSYGQIGIVQENSGNLYVLRIWVKRPAGWRLLIYQAVVIGAPASFESTTGECKNPCAFVPFKPQNEDEREVIRAYQEVERAVAARNSAAWAAHIAEEFFAVTSNSDRPLDKAARMAGLDHQKVAGIAPFPLVSARMFQFGDATVMVSRQQPERGLPLHVTRVWFKRNGAWLEAYSYQTTIQASAWIR